MPNKIHLIRKIDSLKSNWFLWECDRERSDGTIERGTVEGDYIGHLVANETWEPDDREPNREEKRIAQIQKAWEADE